MSKRKHPIVEAGFNYKGPTVASNRVARDEITFYQQQFEEDSQANQPIQGNRFVINLSYRNRKVVKRGGTLLHEKGTLLFSARFIVTAQSFIKARNILKSSIQSNTRDERVEKLVIFGGLATLG